MVLPKFSDTPVICSCKHQRPTLSLLRRDRWEFTKRPMIVGGTTNLGSVHNCKTGLPPDPKNLSGRRLMYTSKNDRKQENTESNCTYLTMLRKLPNETRCDCVAQSGKIKRAEIEHAHASNLRASASALAQQCARAYLIGLPVGAAPWKLLQRWPDHCRMVITNSDKKIDRSRYQKFVNTIELHRLQFQPQSACPVLREGGSCLAVQRQSGGYKDTRLGCVSIKIDR